MSADDDIKELRKVLAAFAMPSVQTMVSRKSSITNAFVNSLIPVITPSAEDVRDALNILKQKHDNVRCVYCGDKSSEWDHLRPLVLNLKPTGYISEIGNLVPACGKCNQSKGNKNWREWIVSKARLSPTTRNVPDIADRIAKLQRFEQWRPSAPIDYRKIVGSEAYDHYWSLWDNICKSMVDAQVVATRLRGQIAAAHGGTDARSEIVQPMVSDLADPTGLQT